MNNVDATVARSLPGHELDPRVLETPEDDPMAPAAGILAGVGIGAAILAVGALISLLAF